MKKIIVIMILAMMMMGVWADDSGILGFNFYLKASYLPTDKLYLPSFSTPDNGIFMATDMKAEIVLLGVVFAGGEMNCQFNFNTSALSGDPFLMDYGFFAGIRIGGLEAGYRHDCYHPILSRGEAHSLVEAGGYDEIYISFKGSVKLF